MEPIYRLYYRPEHLYFRVERKNVLWRNPPRKLFLDAIMRVTPEVAERLLKDILPLYPKSEVSRKSALSEYELSQGCKNPATREDLLPLKEAITDWLVDANLNPQFWYPGRYWLYESALYTLAIHAGYLKTPVNESISVKVPYNAKVTLTLETDGSATLKFKVLDPYTRKFEHYYYATMESFGIAMNSYVEQLMQEYYRLSIEESSTDKSPEHWEWLVLHQVRRLTYAEIADEYGSKRGRPIDPERVGKIIRKNRAAIGLRAKPRLGRPLME
jgi:hypothetical protein